MSTFLPSLFRDNLMDVFQDFDRDLFQGFGRPEHMLYGKHADRMMKTDPRPEALAAIAADYPDFAEKYNQDEESENAAFWFDSGEAIVSSYRTEPVIWKL